VQAHEPRDRHTGLVGGVLGVVGDGLADAPIRLVGGVVGQHIEDEALLDGLLHGVQVKRLRPAAVVGVGRAEQLQGLALRGRREGEERQVRLASAGGDGARQGILGGRHALQYQAGVVGLGGREFLLGGGVREHLLEVAGGVAGLRGVGLIDDHRVAARRQPVDLVEHERELLQRGDDDARLLAREGVGELAGVLVDAHHHAVGVLELVHGVLQLPVEYPPVGDDHHLVEHRPVGRVVQTCEAVGQPGDGVRFPRPRRVLHQVILTGAMRPGVQFQPAHGIPLVKPREDHPRRPLRALLLGLHVDEPGDEVEPRIALPYLFPQVGGAVAMGIHRVAGAHVGAALVERQEARCGAGEAGGHLHQVAVEGEVHHRPPRQDDVLGVAVGAVLVHGVGHRLPRERVLQLGGRHQQAVDQQRQVDGLRRVGCVGELAHHHETVGVVERLQLVVEAGRRPEVRQPQHDALVGDAAPQHIHRAAPVELLGQSFLHALLRPTLAHRRDAPPSRPMRPAGWRR